MVELCIIRKYNSLQIRQSHRPNIQLSVKLSIVVSFSLTFDIEMTSDLIMTHNSTQETDTQDTFLQEAQTYMTYKMLIYIDRYWFPVLIPFGLVGNTLSFLS